MNIQQNSHLARSHIKDFSQWADAVTKLNTAADVFVFNYYLQMGYQKYYYLLCTNVFTDAHMAAWFKCMLLRVRV